MSEISGKMDYLHMRVGGGNAIQQLPGFIPASVIYINDLGIDGHGLQSSFRTAIGFTDD